MDLSNALYPVVQCLPILVRFLDTVHGLQGGDPGGALHQLIGAGLTSLAYIVVVLVKAKVSAGLLTTGLTVVSLVRVRSCRSSTVGSDCLARGSSTTTRPALSG